jgi:integrase
VLVKNITVGRIEAYRLQQLAEPTKRGPRKIASVNRELEVLRAVLNFAAREHIIPKSPFELATTPLLSKADEVRRVRVLTRDEEERLVSVCDKFRSDSSPLADLLVCALDTGLRKSEMLALEWSDIDFESRTITVRALTTKS